MYATNAGYREGVRRYGEAVVRSFIEKVAVIREITNEGELRKFKSLRYEKLKGNRKHQRSIRLNQQFRLILELEQDEHGNLLVIVNIEDYH